MGEKYFPGHHAKTLLKNVSNGAHLTGQVFFCKVNKHYTLEDEQLEPTNHPF